MLTKDKYIKDLVHTVTKMRNNETEIVLIKESDKNKHNKILLKPNNSILLHTKTMHALYNYF